MTGRFTSVAAALLLVVVVGQPAGAQSLGTFSWQLAPYCNVVTVSVTQNGGLYTLDGYDNQCGGAVRASVVGVAIPNPNGSITLGFTIVTPPAGAPVHVQTAIDLASLGGAWSDNQGNSGSFVFTPSGSATGSARPPVGGGGLPPNAVASANIMDGAVGASDIDATQVQRRIQTPCPAGEMMNAVNQDGSVTCAAPSASAGDITGVVAGTGLSGGGTAGDVTLNLLLSGTGTTSVAARSDHTHGVGGVTGANTVIGELAFDQAGLSANTTALGYRAGFAGGQRNTAVGSRALNGPTAGQDNTAVGDQALTVATGSNHTAVGAGALASLTTGQNNVALGADALGNVASGSNNIALGRSAGLSLTTGDGNIYLGSLGGGAESATIRIGQAQDRVFVTGVRGVTTGADNALPVVIDSAGQLGTVSSSRRTKFDIADLDPAVSAALQQLRPVQFRYSQAFADGATPIQYGLIAEEVQDVLPELVATDEAGDPASVKYHVLPALLVAEVQRLEREREALAGAVRELAAELAALRVLVSAAADPR